MSVKRPGLEESWSLGETYNLTVSHDRMGCIIPWTCHECVLCLNMKQREPQRDSPGDITWIWSLRDQSVTISHSQAVWGSGGFNTSPRELVFMAAMFLLCHWPLAYPEEL